MGLRGKGCLVTGGSRGIGRAIALALAREGGHVAVNYVADARAAAEVVAEIEGLGGRAVAVQADVAVPRQAAAMVDRVRQAFGRVDVLVSNAGVIDWVDFFDVTEEFYDRILDTNTKGAFFACQAAARHMRDGRGGRIVIIGSVAGIRATNPRIIPYPVSKAGLVMLTKHLAKLLGPYQITVNAVLPGTVPTDTNAKLLAQEGVAPRIEEVTPLGRLGRASDIVGQVVHLASDEAAWTTGALVPVDGGFSL